MCSFIVSSKTLNPCPVDGRDRAGGARGDARQLVWSPQGGGSGRGTALGGRRGTGGRDGGSSWSLWVPVCTRLCSRLAVRAGLEHLSPAAHSPGTQPPCRQALCGPHTEPNAFTSGGGVASCALAGTSSLHSQSGRGEQRRRVPSGTGHLAVGGGDGPLSLVWRHLTRRLLQQRPRAQPPHVPP